MPGPTVALLALVAALGVPRGDFPEASALAAQPEMPDPLLMRDGTRVADGDAWTKRRRPELIALFEHYMYGKAPGPPGRFVARVERTEGGTFGGKATTKEVRIDFGPDGAPDIRLLVVVPSERRGPFPVFLGLNFNGNHAVDTDTDIALPAGWVPDRSPGVANHRATDAGRGLDAKVWSIADSIEQGYAVATFYCGDVAPDHPGLTDGVHPHFLKAGETKPGPDDWGTVAAWAWGISRAIDYLVTDASVDSERICVVGHSRLGKAAILAAAFDDRVAIAIPHQAGCGGTAPSRADVGETVRQINDRFPHWFCDEFKAFNGHPERLPFDQNGLMALVAPRPLLLTNATGDPWANPAGQFRALRSASAAYKLLGTDGLAADAMPAEGVLIQSTLGFHIRPGKHSMGPDDWKVWRAFADKHFGREDR